MRRAFARRLEGSRHAARDSPADAGGCDFEGFHSPYSVTLSDEEACPSFEPRSPAASREGRRSIEVVDVDDEELHDERCTDDLSRPDAKSIALVHAAEDAAFVETVWDAFRTDVMRVISGIGSRIRKPAPSDLPSDPGAATRHRHRSIWKTRRPSAPSAASLPLSLPRWVTPVRRFEGPGESCGSSPRTPEVPRGDDATTGGAVGTGSSSAARWVSKRRRRQLLASLGSVANAN